MPDLSTPAKARSDGGYPDERHPSDGSCEPTSLPLPMPASCHRLPWGDGRLVLLEAGDGPPLLLIHSINAAASSYEVKPIAEAMQGRRRVFALDLPGFGLSSRGPEVYTVARYVEAILLAARTVREICGGQRVAALALSLSGELLARAALQEPRLFAGLALVTPTGFETGAQRRRGGIPEARPRTGLERFLTAPLWRSGLFSMLVSRPSVRFFLRRTFDGPPDPGLVDYAWQSAHQPGAAYAAFAFASGKLFSPDIRAVYEALELPVWLAHGTRGSFSDFSEAGWTMTRPNWELTSFDTGAFPHFQSPDAFLPRLDSFLGALPQQAPEPSRPAAPHLRVVQNNGDRS
ncbi:alpha/beta hydrolase [Bosea sp. (in: a-proteobacteria)]|uniref:alpha/beta fold hydrolase n=1 Tax=Bosea sp. (in: a-proteobacteria) TaxID=1871050 RepID=UPI002B489B55|nr:alpha/beta hydrolase [Bosea sp. (in: a-proteobacteria)]WRH60093.1 MAG: alpha/beta hydrolase [Bosea sp. (in: a-proteobacteria)]